MNRHATMIFLCATVVIPMAATLPMWMAVIQAAVGGMSIGAHAIMWYDERSRKRIEEAFEPRS